MLLTADWHLTDNAADEYRWEVFEFLLEHLHPGEDLYILGDITDRKDRHSAALVNRLVANLKRLRIHQQDGQIFIIMGNHDKPLFGAPFWKFLDELDGVYFFDEPCVSPAGGDDLLLLPFAELPRDEWADIRFSDYTAIFMHQPVDGVLGENGFKVKGSLMPAFPRGVQIYSGDIHSPQRVGAVEYVGAPHPVDYGDSYTCRFLRLDSQYRVRDVITLDATRKLSIIIRPGEDIYDIPVRPGDRAKVSIYLDPSDLASWVGRRDEVEAWAAAGEVQLAQIEILINSPNLADGERAVLAPNISVDPEQILTEFCAAHGIDGELATEGHALLNVALKEAASR